MSNYWKLVVPILSGKVPKMVSGQLARKYYSILYTPVGGIAHNLIWKLDSFTKLFS